jgi:hypothetical protein
METIKDHLNNFINLVIELKNKENPSVDHKIEVDEGKKYYRIIDARGSSRSVYCFVDKTTGDIYKSARWKAPAKHIRGNIKNGLDGVTAYGAVYWR